MGQQVGSAVGGKLGNSPAQYAQPFESAGGVTPEQMALADYSYGQNLTETQGQFAPQGEGGGAGMSTMDTQAATGAQIGKALNLGSMSDTDTDAEYKAYQVANQVSDINQGAAQTTLGQQVGGLAGLANLAQSGQQGAGYSTGVSGG